MVNDRILRRTEVQKMIGNPSKATLYRWIKNGEFPPPRRLGGGSVGWLESTITDWMRSRPVAYFCEKED